MKHSIFSVSYSIFAGFFCIMIMLTKYFSPLETVEDVKLVEFSLLETVADSKLIELTDIKLESLLESRK